MKTQFYPVVGGLTVILCLNGCDQNTSENATNRNATPTAAPAVSTNTGPATIEFAQTSFDFGKMPEHESRTAQIEFTNTGGQPLVISEVKTTCGCTAAALAKRQYAPGETGTVDITFDPTSPGDDQKKYVNIISNGVEGGLSRLMITADVQPFIIYEPRMVTMGVLPFGRLHNEYVAVSSPDENFEIVSVSTTNPDVTASEISPDELPPGMTAEPGKKYVRLTIPPHAPWGGLYGALDVGIRGKPSPDAEPIIYSSSIRIAAEMFGNLKAEANTFRFGVAPGERFTRTVTLKSADGSPFKLIDAQIANSDLPDAELTTNQKSPGVYELTLTATGGSIIKSYRGQVLVETDMPGEESIEVPIFGVVREKSAGVR